MSVNLKFDNSDQATSHLLSNGWRLTADNQWYKLGSHHTIRFVTPMRPTGVTMTDEETGFEYPDMEPVPGVHINICCPSGCCKSNVTVNSPCEVFS